MLGDVEELAKVYLDLGVLYGEQEKMDQSLEYAQKAAELFKNNDNRNDYIHALNNIGDCYFHLKEHQKGLDALIIAYELSIEEGLNLKTATVLITPGEIHQAMGEYQKALKNLFSGLRISRQKNSSWHEIHFLMQIGSVFLKKKKYKKAQKYLNNALLLAEENDMKKVCLDIQRLIWTLYKNKGDYKNAFNTLMKYSELEKANFNLESEKKVRNIEADSLRDANKRINIISKIGQKITSILDMKSVLDLIYESVNNLMDAYVLGIADYNEEKGKISYEMFIENGQHLKPVYCSVNDKNSLAALVIREKKDLIIHDFEKEIAVYLPGEDVVFFGINDVTTQSLLYTPLQIGGQITGVITVQSKKKQAYSLSDMDSLKILSSYIAVALKNATQAAFIKKAVKELEVLNEDLKNISIIDELTGLYNRRGFFENAERYYKQSKRLEYHFLLLFIDLDKLKHINDTFGHEEGDFAIISVSKILKRSFRDIDIISRLGGDEFIVLAINAVNDDYPIIRERVDHNMEEYNLKLKKP